MNSKFANFVQIILFFWVLVAVVVGLVSKQVGYGFILAPFLFLVIYLQNFIVSTLFSLFWIWALGSNDTIFLLIPFFGIKHTNLKYFVIAVTLALIFIFVRCVYKQLPLSEFVAVLGVYLFLFLKCFQKEEKINQTVALTSTSTNNNQVLAVINKIELKLAHYRLLSYRYTQASGDKDCPKHGNFAPYYDAKYVSRVRRVVLAYNNITEYQLATALAHKAVTIIDFYDEDRLPENLRNPK